MYLLKKNWLLYMGCSILTMVQFASSYGSTKVHFEVSINRGTRDFRKQTLDESFIVRA